MNKGDIVKLALGHHEPGEELSRYILLDDPKEENGLGEQRSRVCIEFIGEQIGDEFCPTDMMLRPIETVSIEAICPAPDTTLQCN